MTMRVALFLSALLVGSSAHDPNSDAQYLSVKSVKGGGGQYQYRGGDNLARFYNNTQAGYGVANHTAPVIPKVGVCYVEVPTASLARDPKHVPAGNGSRPDLSRIQTCCTGYTRNIYNFHLCEPVCTSECVNALCTAPETCSCYPDHVKNLAGFCVATCPIGCQNGHCAGGECLCKEGFQLDRDGRFCVPHCRDNCGGVGNCTAPNTCSCQPGFHSTPEGSCKTGLSQQTLTQQNHQSCGSCANGYCVGTECRCAPGYLLYKGECLARCDPSCGPNLQCVAPNVCSQSRQTPNVPQSNTNQYPNQYPQYPYTNQPQNSTSHGQYPSQYPQNGTINVQYPGGQYPNGQNLNINNQSQNHPGYGSSHYPSALPSPYQNPIYAQYPAQYPQAQPKPYQYQPLNQPNITNLPNQGHSQQPGQQHLYPNLPHNHYPSSLNQVNNRTDGQIFYQNTYNPLENVTFNMQQGPQEHTQGQGQYVPHGQPGQVQYWPQGPNTQGQYVPQGPNTQGQNGPQGQYGPQGPNTQGPTSPYGPSGPYGQYVPQVQGHYVPQGQEQSQNWPNQVPQCAQACLNGNCVGTNRCECFPGYTLDQTDSTGTRCLPYCPGGCHNGYCSAPNTCTCMLGYHTDFSVKGRSVCVKRDRRSIEEKPVNVAELLVFEIPDY